MRFIDTLKGIFQPKPARVVEVDSGYRARPGQKVDARYLYAPGGENAEAALVQYALSNWVYTAVSKIAEAATVAPLMVHRKGQIGERVDNHPLLDLLGPEGRPNDNQDSFEFWEEHFSSLLLAGNSYWFWESVRGGAPTAVYPLDPRFMKIVPGATRTIDHYEYWYMGERVKLNPIQITQYKRYNPFSPYYGLSALEALRLEVNSDRTMAAWNAEFFNGPAMPAGILVIPPDVTPDERNRIEAELNAKHVGERRTAVVRAAAGATTWLEAGLKGTDIDFSSGRMLSRQAVYEALGLPLGMMSDASTEAHARVSERVFLAGVWKWHVRTATKLNADAMPFWLGFLSLRAVFEDVRIADADQLSKLIKAIEGHVTSNEIRTKYLGMPPREGGDDVVKSNGAAAGLSAGSVNPENRGNLQPVSRPRPARDEVSA